MSVTRARCVLKGAPADGAALFDLPTHPGFLRKLTGLEPLRHVEEAVARAVEKLDVDLLYGSVPSEPPAPEGDPNRYGLYAVEWRHEGAPRYRGDWAAYDPSRHRPQDPAAQSDESCRRWLQARLERDRRLVGATALPIGYTFTTCLQYAAEDLDWPEWLAACVEAPQRVSAVLDRLERAGARMVRACADAGVEAMLAHDDLAMATGLIFPPDWLRRHVLPRYRRLFAVVRQRGIPLLFSTDGRFVEMARDLMDVGADGFFLDAPCVTVEDIVQRCGPHLVYFTGPPPALMRWGTVSQVREAMRKLANATRGLPRFFFHMVGGWTHDMPTENVQAFYDFCRC